MLLRSRLSSPHILKSRLLIRGQNTLRLKNTIEFSSPMRILKHSTDKFVRLYSNKLAQDRSTIVHDKESASHLGHTHSHSHTHMEVNPMLVLSREQFKKNPGVRITWIGLGINIGMAAGKAIGGIVFHSQALLADSVHALSDLVSDFLTLFSVGFSSGNCTREYPNGMGKVETIGSLAVSSILLTAGISIGWSALCSIVGPIIPHTILDTLYTIMGEGHSHSHNITKEVTNINAAWIAAASIGAKEWIYQATKKVAIKTHSNVLMANAWHHRVDSLTSLVALTTITSGYFLNIQSLDAIGGLVVSGLVIKAGFDGLSISVKELLDKALPSNDPLYEKITTLLNKSLSELPIADYADVCSLRNLVVTRSGRNILVEAHLSVPKDVKVTLPELERIRHELRQRLSQELPSLFKTRIEFSRDDSPYYAPPLNHLHHSSQNRQLH